MKPNVQGIALPLIWATNGHKRMTSRVSLNAMAMAQQFSSLDVLHT
jgi:hypothetical protein